MGIFRDVVIFKDHFARAQAFTTTPGVNGWTIKDTSAAGTPTYLCTSADGGQAVLTCDNTSEAQVVTLYHNDVLMYDIDRLLYMRFIASVSGVDSVTTISMGLASGQADTSDNITRNTWFKMDGSASTSNVVCETDDNATDTDDKATNTTLSSTAKLFEIDFSFGTSDIRFLIDGKRVAPTTTFTMAGATAQMQPFFQLQKASGTGTPALTLKMVEIAMRVAK